MDYTDMVKSRTCANTKVVSEPPLAMDFPGLGTFVTT